MVRRQSPARMLKSSVGSSLRSVIVRSPPPLFFSVTLWAGLIWPGSQAPKLRSDGDTSTLGDETSPTMVTLGGLVGPSSLTSRVVERGPKAPLVGRKTTSILQWPPAIRV